MVQNYASQGSSKAVAKEAVAKGATFRKRKNSRIFNYKTNLKSKRWKSYCFLSSFLNLNLGLVHDLLQVQFPREFEAVILKTVCRRGANFYAAHSKILACYGRPWREYIEEVHECTTPGFSSNVRHDNFFGWNFRHLTT